MSLQGKNALVTGGSRGIGASTVKSLAEEGANILIVFTSASSEQLSQDILASLPPGRHDLVQADMSTLEAPKTIIDAATRLWGGRIDILIHNAGKSTKALLEDETPDGWEATMNTNCRGVWMLTQAALPFIPRGGRIIIVGSISGRTGGPKQMTYSASKAVVESFVKVWTNELFVTRFSAYSGQRGICINAVAPGPVDTDMFNSNTQEYIDKSISTNGQATPQQIADCIMFLAGDKSRWVTGSVMQTNGGAVFN